MVPNLHSTNWNWTHFPSDFHEQLITNGQDPSGLRDETRWVPLPEVSTSSSITLASPIVSLRLTTVIKWVPWSSLLSLLSYWSRSSPLLTIPSLSIVTTRYSSLTISQITVSLPITFVIIIMCPLGSSGQPRSTSRTHFYQLTTNIVITSLVDHSTFILLVYHINLLFL